MLASAMLASATPATLSPLSRSPSPRWPRSRCPPTPSSPSRRTSSWRLCATTPPAGPSPVPKLIVELSHIFGLHKNESLFYKTPPSPFH